MLSHTIILHVSYQGVEERSEAFTAKATDPGLITERFEQQILDGVVSFPTHEGGVKIVKDPQAIRVEFLD